jgi:hypothetical protein
MRESPHFLRLELFGPLLGMAVSIVMLLTRSVDLDFRASLISVAGVFAGIVTAYSMISVLRLRPRPSVFVSYCPADKQVADELLRRLDKTNARILVDSREMLVGDSIVQRINEFVEKSDFIVLIISSNWSQSEWAKQELKIVLSSQKRILPLVVDRDALPEQLHGIKFADLRANSDVALDQIVDSVLKRPSHAEYGSDLTHSELR